MNILCTFPISISWVCYTTRTPFLARSYPYIGDRSTYSKSRLLSEPKTDYNVIREIFQILTYQELILGYQLYTNTEFKARKN